MTVCFIDIWHYQRALIVGFWKARWLEGSAYVHGVTIYPFEHACKRIALRFPISFSLAG